MDSGLVPPVVSRTEALPRKPRGPRTITPGPDYLIDQMKFYILVSSIVNSMRDDTCRISQSVGSLCGRGRRRPGLRVTLADLDVSVRRPPPLHPSRHSHRPGDLLVTRKWSISWQWSGAEVMFQAWLSGVLGTMIMLAVARVAAAATAANVMAV